MAYLVWILTILAIILGFLLGLILGMTHDYRKKAVGTLLIGYTGEEDDSVHLFLNMDKAVELLETPHLVEMGQAKRRKLLEEKVDINGYFMQEMDRLAKVGRKGK